MQVRQYQTDLKQNIYAAWREYLNVIAVLPTGGGKTWTFSEIVKEFNGPAAAIAHRQELVSQISLSFAKHGIRHRIIGPDNVVRLINRLHVEELGQSWYHPNAPTAVVGVDTLIARAGKLKRWAESIGLWVTDECFPAGTRIDGVPIETLKPGDYVTAFNESSGGFEKREVIRLFTNPAPESLLKLDIRGHHALEVTKGHPFWTKRGWVEAGNLNTSDEVLIYEMHPLSDANSRNERSAALPVPENGQDILQETVRLRTPGCEQKAPRKIGSTLRGLLDLRKTFRYVRSPFSPVQKDRSRVLWPSLFEGLQREAGLGNNGGDESKVCLRTDDKKQSDALRRNPAESIGNIKTDRTRAKTEGRERPHKPGRGRFTVSTLRSWFQRSSSNKNREASGLGVPPSVQSRRREPSVKDSNRGGREQPRFVSSESSRYQKGHPTHWARLEGVTVQKFRDIRKSGTGLRDGFVYNIEVEGLHTYIAEGVVVHNCHHLLEGNKWGKAAAMFPNAKGLGVTATPLRADGKGLGRHAEGVFDTMVEGPSMRDLIHQGYLTDYKIFAPPSDFVRPGADKVGSTGDFSTATGSKAVRGSQVIGNIVEHYLRISPGKLGITFVPDVETATNTAAEFNAAGVPAAVVSAKTPDAERVRILRDFKARKRLMLVNVDLFGEGFDLPAIEVVIMARPTESFGLYCQQFGRALRILNGKIVAIIIDHVGNVVRHGLPDSPRVWTLDRRDRRSKSAPSDAIPVKACPKCTAVYERVYSACPYCGFKPLLMARSGPEFVDGDLAELDPATLAALRGEAVDLEMTPLEYLQKSGASRLPHVAAMSAAKRHTQKQEAQVALRESIAWWAGYQRAAGRPDSESYRRFYFKFGTDVLSAQALGTRDATELKARITLDLGR